jgi:hypothetical protein
MPVWDSKQNFADIVVQYLDKERWHARMPSKEDYHMLRDMVGIEKNAELDRVWKHWNQIGRFKRGRTQQGRMMLDARSFVAAMEVYEETRRGLTGDEETRRKFKVEMTRQARQEMKGDEEWETWIDVHNTMETVKHRAATDWRRYEPLCVWVPGSTPDEYLKVRSGV